MLFLEGNGSMFDLTGGSGRQCQHTRSTQAQLWLAGLCPEQSMTHGWVGKILTLLQFK